MENSQAPPSAAAQHVFHIPELLETVLMHLPPRELLLVQRTARSFRHTVQGSVRLRRKLFLEPDWTLSTCASASAHPYAGGPRGDGRALLRPKNNHLLLRAFPGCYPTITLVIASADTLQAAPQASTTLQQLTAADDPRGIGPSSSSSSTENSEQWSWDVCISFPADTQKADSSAEAKPAAVTEPTASWRRMYLCQPPCRALHLVRRWSRSPVAAVVRDGGITMGDLYDEATRPHPAHAGRKWHPSYISSDRDWHFEGNVRCESFVG